MFIEHNFEQIRAMMTYAHEHSEAERRQGEGESGFDFRYFVNCSNALFIKAENVRAPARPYPPGRSRGSNP